jgi:hypothetical protein
MSVELTPEQKAEQDAADHNCDLGKREHKWIWVWDEKTWTNEGRCSKCGKTKILTRKEGDRE